jgi:uncharacterized CHY-type Zn-finger protein
MSKQDLHRRVMARSMWLTQTHHYPQAYHCDGCDPTHIVAAYPVTHIRGNKRLCGECADEYDRRELAAVKRQCMSCGALVALSETIGDLWQCSDCVTDEARVRSEQRQ